MPTPFEIMEAKRQRILQEAAQVEQDMRELERILREYKLRVVADLDNFEPAEQRERGIPHGIKEEAEGIIRAAGYPMAISDLATMLADRGFELDTARDYTSSLTAVLLRASDLRYIPKVGWWLKGVSWPPTSEDIEGLSKPKEERQRGRRRSPEKERLYEELRRLLEGREEPMLFRDIFEHITKANITIGGVDQRQNLSSFMTSIPEFKSHGPAGRGGWTFVADRIAVDDDENDPAWMHNPLKRKVIETARRILEGRTARMPTRELLAAVKDAGLDFGDIRNDKDYLMNALREAEFFDAVRIEGWRYLPEKDPENKGN